eukprot:7989322-Ditylum_brightwellii.AAC.1
MFGQLRLIIREFTSLEFAQLVEKQVQRLMLMYKHGFRPSWDPREGYQETFEDFFDFTGADTSAAE